MKSKTFTGKDKQDLDKQVWAWRSQSSKVAVKKTYPDEILPVVASKPAGKFAPKSSVDLVSRKIDYED
jgi:hypothetical protein